MMAKLLEEIQLQSVDNHPESQRDWEVSPRLSDVCR